MNKDITRFVIGYDETEPLCAIEPEDEMIGKMLYEILGRIETVWHALSSVVQSLLSQLITTPTT
jgi:hypothetical protein